MTPSIGVVFPPWYPPEQLRDAARAAEETGVDQLWLWEDCFKESGIAAAAASLAWTERLTVAIGLVPAPLRNVALLAMEVATLERLFPGRFVPVVGHGVQSWMGQVGGRVESPLTLLREYVVALEPAARGRDRDDLGPLRVARRRGSRLAAAAARAGARWRRRPAHPRAARRGGVGRAARLAQLADGRRRRARACRRGRALPGRARPDIALLLLTVRGEAARERLASYVGELSGDPATEPGLAGDAATVAAGVRRFADAGVGTVVLTPPEDEPDIVGWIRWVGTEVMPLV